MIEKRFFGSTANGEAVEIYKIQNANGAIAEIMTYGATLHSLSVPNAQGGFTQVVVGFDDLNGHLNWSDYQGVTVGRYANRIENGHFEINGVSYDIDKNEEGKTCLHGGGEFSSALWRELDCGENSLTLCYDSPEGSRGFPGRVLAKVSFTLSDKNELIIDYDAAADKATVLNFTNHTYFNLGGQDILNHTLKIDADFFTPTDDSNIPLNNHLALENTPFDFRAAKTVGKDIENEDYQLSKCRGYDHNFCLNGGNETKPAAELYSPESGVLMKVFTDLPGIQLYTGNFLMGWPGKNGKKTEKHSGLCLETQYYPNTPNRPDFPQCTFKAGEHFISKTVFAFEVK